MEEKFGIQTKMFMLEELKEKFNTYPNFIITNYKGLTSQEVESLRKLLGESSSLYCVVKNSIAKRVLDQIKLKDMDQFIQGEVGIGFAGDAIGASKALVDFSRGHSSLKIQCGFLDGKLEASARIKQLAALPPKEILLSLLFSCMKSPITGFVGVLNGLLRNFVYAINEIKNKREYHTPKSVDEKKEGGEKK